MENTKAVTSNLLNVEEVCRVLRCSKTTLSRLGIPQVKIRRRKFYRLETVNTWLSTQEQSKEAHNE